VDVERALNAFWSCSPASASPADRCGPDVIVLASVLTDVRMKLRGMLVEVALTIARDAVILFDLPCISINSYLRVLRDARYGMDDVTSVGQLSSSSLTGAAATCPVFYVPLAQPRAGARSPQQHRAVRDILSAGDAVISSSLVRDSRADPVTHLLSQVLELRNLVAFQQDVLNLPSLPHTPWPRTRGDVPATDGLAGGRAAEFQASLPAAQILQRLHVARFMDDTDPEGVDSDVVNGVHADGSADNRCPLQFSVLIIGQSNERFVFNQTAWALVEALTALGFTADIVLCGSILDTIPLLATGFSCDTTRLWHRQVIVLGANILSQTRAQSAATATRPEPGPAFPLVLQEAMHMLPPGAILYQFEHVTQALKSTQWMTDEYMQVLRAFDVWDYSW
jgi:hypothetical protein